ncbi:MAG: hypothetical protein DSZ24_06035 [Thermodesulfatator sp.]|nr:MAG: hypothetical protein DSZ24_06035 [Thermodesulfatator sp.]
MQPLSVAYSYQPGRSRARRRAQGLTLRRVLGLLLGFLVALPWVLGGIYLYQWHALHRACQRERTRQGQLRKTWEALTAEEVVRQKVAPLGLFKPTEKEIVRLP